jgi:hypothetical protein
MSLIERNEYYKRFGGQNHDFIWLIEHLLSFSDKILGCDMIFPETVFFKDGKADFFIKMDRAFSLVAIRN